MSRAPAHTLLRRRARHEIRFECFHEAAKFEQLTRTATSDAARAECLAKALEWRKLAEQAQAKDASQIEELRDPS